MPMLTCKCNESRQEEQRVGHVGGETISSQRPERHKFSDWTESNSHNQTVT